MRIPDGGAAHYAHRAGAERRARADGRRYGGDVTVGAVLLVFGMGLFQLGAEMAMSPLGEGIGVQMERVKRIPVIVAIAFVMGVIITIAEPDLQVLAQQVPSIRIRCLFIRLPSAWARFWRWQSCAF